MAVPALEPDVVGEAVVADVLVPVVAVPDAVVPEVVVPLVVVPDAVPEVDVVPDVPVVAVPEVVEADPAEPVEPDALGVFAEVLVPAPVEPAAVAAVFCAVLVLCEELVVDPELVLTRAIDATAAVVVAVRLESAGSLPETSCRKITDQSARNSASAIATTRLRITDTRRSRARSRCATRPVASVRALGRAAAGGVPERLRGLGASEGVIGTSLRSWSDAMTTRSRHGVAAP